MYIYSALQGNKRLFFSKDTVYGGYTSKSWNSPKEPKMILDKYAFIFYETPGGEAFYPKK